MPRPFLVPLAFIYTLCSTPAVAGALEQLQSFVQTRTLTSQFVQTNTVRGKKQTSSGQLAISRPDRFRWEYLRPEPQLIVGDGVSLWIYDADLNQVSVRDQKQSLGETPAALLAGTTAVSRYYSLVDQGNRDGLDWLQATPRSGGQSYSTIRMAFSGNELKIMELMDFTGQTTRIEFSGWKKNPAVSPNQFTFTPPAGADVLRD